MTIETKLKSRLKTKFKKSKQIIKWDKERLRKKPFHRRGSGRYLGITIFDRDERTKEIPTGYCGSIKITTGGYLQIWTNGRYQFISKETAIVLLNRLLNFYGAGLKEIDKRITKLEIKNRLRKKSNH